MLISHMEPAPAVARITDFAWKTRNSPVRLFRPVAPTTRAPCTPFIVQQARAHNAVEYLHAEPLAFLLENGLKCAAPDADDDVGALFRRIEARFSRVRIRQEGCGWVP